MNQKEAVAFLLYERLRKNGLTEDEMMLISSNDAIAEHVATIMQELSRQIDEVTGGLVASDLEHCFKLARVALAEKFETYNEKGVRILASLIFLTKNQRKFNATATDIGRVLGISRQAVTQQTRTIGMSIEEFQRLVP